MATDQDVRDIRKDVQRIETEGCAHKGTQDKGIENLWIAVDGEKKERSNMFIKTIVLVVTIVVGAMIANIYATSSVVEQVMTNVMKAQATTRK